jgi:HD-GYP domain-containing protein (c-di-GMP phosphodiesterase class II)
MNSTVTHLILHDCKIAYAITDRNLNVVEVGGAVGIFHDDHKTCLGRSLVDLVPELVGSEVVLAEILAGELPRYQLSLVNRETADGRTVYLTMVDLPHRDRAGQIAGFVHWVEDVTEMGTLTQHFRHQRNELRLLRDRLARQNLELTELSDQLRNLNVELEQRVAERTAELRTTIERVQQEIADRKRAEEALQHNLETLHRVLEETIQAVAFTVEIKDPYTAGHQRRVAQLACAIAKDMGLPEEQIEGIYMAGLVHDIAKINVPGEILSKPGRLSPFELGIIQVHPQAGHDILKTVEFPWPIAQIVLQHHERINGSGYPQGLKGDQILIQARILSVADVVVAMASHRPYRPALGVDEALEEILQNRDILYDPQVVDTCLRLFTEKGFVLE